MSNDNITLPFTLRIDTLDKLTADYWSLGNATYKEILDRSFWPPRPLTTLFSVTIHNQSSWNDLVCGNRSVRINPFWCLKHDCPYVSRALMDDLRRRALPLWTLFSTPAGVNALAVYLSWQLAHHEHLDLSLFEIRKMLDGTLCTPNGIPIINEITRAAEQGFVLVDGNHKDTAHVACSMFHSFLNGFSFMLTTMVSTPVERWSLDMMMDMHALVCPNWQRGFRQHDVRHGEKTNPHMFPEVPHLMKEYLAWLKFYHAHECVDNAILALYAFIHIHPFPDCNGRTGRLLMNAIFLQEGIIPPYFILAENMQDLINEQTSAYVGGPGPIMNRFFDNLINSVSSFAGITSDERNKVKVAQLPSFVVGFGQHGVVHKQKDEL
eukprot:TRINITY_DN8936_c0_g1_i1.p1 TRINITY_DN8936_c0_g1~~TRINITY_DN8936_c0_g1_i1.p1  ORF type:complete len:379 (-),score=52.48 TRINITY_DN8936_c0_g1_i1:133-1269(-)